MPLYQVRSLDVLGNPVDGYEVNDSRNAGEVYIQPQAPAQPGETIQDRLDRNHDFEENVFAALVEADLIGAHEAGIELEFNDGMIEVSGEERAFAGDNDNDGPRFIDMAPRGSPPSRRDTLKFEQAQRAAEEQLEEGETLMVDAAQRPLLSLDDLSQDRLVHDGNEFWETKLLVPSQGGNMTADEHELGVYLSYDRETIGIDVVFLHHGRPEDPVDYFEYPLKDWQRSPTFGVDPVTGEELEPTKQQVGEILVALDAFMEGR